MNCSKCGARVKEGDAFCLSCGAPLNAPGAVRQAEPAGVSTVLRRVGKMPIILGACVLVALVILLVVLATRSHTIDLEELVEVEFAGYDTVGRAYVSMDINAYDAALSEALGKDHISEVDRDVYYTCSSALTLTLDRQNGLSNGDTVTVEIEYDNDALKEYRLRYKGASVSFQVEGLEPLTEVDPFAGLQIIFTGVSPNGRVELSYEGGSDYVNQGSFSCDRTENLQNGDQVTVTIPSYNPEVATNYGYRFITTEKTYTVEGLPEYIDSYDLIPAETLAHLKQETEDTILAYVARDYSKECPLGELSYAGYLLLTEKPGSGYQTHNVLYLVYRGVLSHTGDEFHDSTIYFPVGYCNLTNTAQGVSYEGGEDIEGYTNLTDSFFGYYTYGYDNPLVLYAELVTEQQDNYDCQAGDGMEGYDTYTPITALSELRERDLTLLTDRAKELIQSYISEEYTAAQASALTLVGEYLLISKKQGSDYRNNNQLIVVYSATVTSNNDRFETATVYYPVRFEGLINLPRDEFMYVRESNVCGSVRFPDSSVYSDGYLDGADMFGDLVTAERDSYTYEVSEGLRAFGT